MSLHIILPHCFRKIAFCNMDINMQPFALMSCRASLLAQRVKHLPVMWKTQVWSLSREDPLEKEMATHSSILAWRIPWTEEPDGLQPMGSQRVGHNWATSLSLSLGYVGLICSTWDLSLQSMDSWVMTRGLSCSLEYGILDPWPGIKTLSAALQGGILTAGPPGKSLYVLSYYHYHH